MLFFPRRSSENGEAVEKGMGGNHGERAGKRVFSLSRRPPRSFPQWAILFPIRKTLPIEEMHRAGAISSRVADGGPKALPKAGAESRSRDSDCVSKRLQGHRQMAGSGSAVGTTESFFENDDRSVAAPPQLRFSPGKSSKPGRSPRSSPVRIFSTVAVNSSAARPSDFSAAQVSISIA